MDGQISIFDFDKPEDRILEVIKEKPWARVCKGSKAECFENPENGICTSLWKCSKRRQYKTLNAYYLEQMDGRRTLATPIGGSTILCEENKAEADELIRSVKAYYGW